jgi:hypothetical protein
MFLEGRSDSQAYTNPHYGDLSLRLSVFCDFVAVDTSYQIVPASMSDTWQCVHFRVHADNSSPTPVREGRFPSRVKPKKMLGDRKSMRRHEGSESIMCISRRNVGRKLDDI